jgi:hypothetical protein
MGATARPETYDVAETNHLSGLTAKITTFDGASRIVTVDGVGCTASICSRTAIKGNTDGHILARSWLDAIVFIKDTTENSAVLVMKDGTERRISLVKDFRVLYFDPRFSGPRRLDIAKVKSVEFLAPAR